MVHTTRAFRVLIDRHQNQVYDLDDIENDDRAVIQATTPDSDVTETNSGSSDGSEIERLTQVLRDTPIPSQAPFNEAQNLIQSDEEDTDDDLQTIQIPLDTPLYSIQSTKWSKPQNTPPATPPLQNIKSRTPTTDVTSSKRRRRCLLLELDNENNDSKGSPKRARTGTSPFVRLRTSFEAKLAKAGYQDDNTGVEIVSARKVTKAASAVSTTVHLESTVHKTVEKTAVGTTKETAIVLDDD